MKIQIKTTLRFSFFHRLLNITKKKMKYTDINVRKENTSSLLEGMQTGTTTTEINRRVPKITKSIYVLYDLAYPQ